jgi:hypothetical protein
MRNVERLLLTAPEDEARMSDKDRGLIIVSVSGLRTWATGISSARREVGPRLFGPRKGNKGKSNLRES